MWLPHFRDEKSEARLRLINYSRSIGQLVELKYKPGLSDPAAGLRSQLENSSSLGEGGRGGGRVSRWMGHSLSGFKAF